MKVLIQSDGSLSETGIFYFDTYFIQNIEDVGKQDWKLILKYFDVKSKTEKMFFFTSINIESISKIVNIFIKVQSSLKLIQGSSKMIWEYQSSVFAIELITNDALSLLHRLGSEMYEGDTSSCSVASSCRNQLEVLSVQFS